MPSRVSWLQPVKVVYLELLDFVNHEQIVAHMQKIETWVQASTPTTVHLVVDASGMDFLPTSLQFLSEVSRPLANLPNMGYVIVFGTKSPFIATLATLICQIVRFKYKNTHTLDEAMEYLSKVDPELEIVA
jgi:hypothetical protein